MRTYYNKNPNLPKFYFDLDLFKQQQKLKKEDPITVSPVDSSDYDFLVPEEDDSITTVLQIPQEKEMENVVEKKEEKIMDWFKCDETITFAEKCSFQPKNYRSYFSQYNTLHNAGIKVSGAQEGGQLGCHNNDFTFLSDCTFLSGPQGQIVSIEIPEEEDTLKKEHFDLMGELDCLGMRNYPVGVETVVFRVIYDTTSEYYMWVGLNVYRVRTNQTFRARIQLNSIFVTSYVTPDFFLDCGNTSFELCENIWSPYNRDLIIESEEGVQFLVNDKVYSCKRNNWFPLTSFMGKLVTSDNNTVSVSELPDGSYSIGHKNVVSNWEFFSSDRVGNDDNFILNKKLDGHSIAGDSSSFIEYRDRICPYPHLVNLKIKEKIQIQESRQMVYFYEDYPASAYHFEKMCSNKEESDDYNLYKGNLSVKKGHGFPRKKKKFFGPCSYPTFDYFYDNLMDKLCTKFIVLSKERWKEDENIKKNKNFNYTPYEREDRVIRCYSKPINLRSFLSSFYEFGHYWKFKKMFLLNYNRKYLKKYNRIIVSSSKILISKKKDFDDDVLGCFKKKYFIILERVLVSELSRRKPFEEDEFLVEYFNLLCPGYHNGVFEDMDRIENSMRSIKKKK